jgi:3-methyladenine DNA glycosylase AlkD
MNDISADVSSLISDYDGNNPGLTASRLRNYWSQHAPLSTGGIKAEEREMQETLGIPVPVLKKIAAPLAREAKRYPNEFLPLALLLWDEYGREGRVIAALVLGKIELSEPANTIPILRDLCRTCYTWEDADRLAMDALEPIVRKEPEEWLGAIEPWLSDENRWVRRAGITVVGRLPMKQPTYTLHCLSLAEPLLYDLEEVVKKAVSFAVRLSARGDAAAVREFLNAHVPPSDPAATWVLCDVIRSMSPSLKSDFKPLLPNYKRWAADPGLSGVEQRSVNSAAKILRNL